MAKIPTTPKSYRVKVGLLHDGNLYRPDKTVQLDDDAAEDLITLGIIDAPAQDNDRSQMADNPPPAA